MIPIVLIALAYVLGVLWGLYNKCIALFCLILCLSLINQKWKVIIISIVVFVTGFLYTSFRIKKFDYKYSSGPITLKLEIISEAIEKSKTNSYIAKNDNNDKFIIYISKEEKIDYGMIVEINGELEIPDTARNRGGFNYRRYLNSQNIFGTIYVNNIEIIELQQNDIIYTIKKSIEKSFLMLLPINHVGILEGMIIGDTSYVTEEIEESFRNSGISHLLAVSGANVAYVLILCKFVFQRVLGRNVSNFLTIIFIVLFTILSGGSASVVRAAIMAIIIIISEFFSQKPNTYASISFAILFILARNPLIICDVGFVLSFSGTLGIVLFEAKINNYMESKIKYNKETVYGKVINLMIETLAVTISAQLAVTPIVLYYFNNFSCISILANLVIVPATGSITIVGIVMYITSLIYMPLAKLISYSVYSIIQFVILSSSFFAQLPYSTLLTPTPSIYLIIIYYLALYNMFFKKSRKVNIAILLIVSMLIIISNFPKSYININMVDVGQGDSIFIETSKGKTILVDTGGTENSDYDVGEKILIPYILDRGARKIDYVFLSHMHEDHVEGVISLIKKLKVENIIIGRQGVDTTLYNKIVSLAREKGINIIEVKKGDVINIDGIIFDIILAEEKSANLNNTSLVLKMSYGNISMLFTGDIEKEFEENIGVKTNILKVAHHGSNSSSTEEFLKNNLPQIALISVGKGNSYGHPNKEVLERLEALGVNIYRTDVNGEIYLKIYKNGKMKINTMYKLSK